MKIQSGWTENLSCGGLFVSTDRRFDSDASVSVAFSFPGLLSEIPADCRVAWVRKETPMQMGGIGLEVREELVRERLAEISRRAADGTAAALSRRFRVLVVEDNARVVRSYQRLLKHLQPGWDEVAEILFASNGQIALDLIGEQAFDLVVSDIYMPVMDGFTMVERLRDNSATANIPILLVTGGRGGERERAAELGIGAFLYKPIQFARIAETIVCLATLGHERSDSTI